METASHLAFVTYIASLKLKLDHPVKMIFHNNIESVFSGLMDKQVTWYPSDQ